MKLSFVIDDYLKILFLIMVFPFPCLYPCATQRDDIEVLDEPLYANFLRVTGLDRPYREELLSKMVCLRKFSIFLKFFNWFSNLAGPFFFTREFWRLCLLKVLDIVLVYCSILFLCFILKNVGFLNVTGSWWR